MGNHLSSFQNLAEANYDPEIDFRHSEHDPSEMIKLTFYPINCEGQFVDDPEKIFDFAKSSFYFTEVFSHMDFMRLLNLLEKKWIMQGKEWRII